MRKKEVINLIIKENHGKHLEVLKKLQADEEDALPGDIETIKSERKDKESHE